MTKPRSLTTGSRRLSPLADLRTRAISALRPGRPLRVRVQNIGHMLSGNGVAMLLAMVSLAMMMRSLGPSQYGVLALVVSYGRVIERIMRFESWQPMIKYAAGVRGPRAKQDLRQLYSFGLRLDVGACLCSSLAAIALALIARPLLGMSEISVDLIIIYSFSLLLNFTGLATAVLRLAGRFRTLAYAQASGNLLRVVLCAYGLWAHSSLFYFGWVWSICQIFSACLYFVLGWRELRRQEIGNVITVSCRGVTQRFPGIMQFAWSSNLSMTIRSSANDFDVLVIGWLADEISAGLYFFAKRFAKAVQQVNVQVQAVLYPDVARLWADGAYRKFARATMQIQALLAGFFVIAFLLILLFGGALIRLGPGAAYEAALPMLMVQIIAVGLTTHAAPSRTALMAMGRQSSVLKVVLVGTLLFHILLFTLVPRIGAMGANFAHVVLALICAVSFDSMLRRGVGTARAARRSARAAS